MMTNTLKVIVLIFVAGCARSGSNVTQSCGSDAGLKLCVTASRRAPDTAAVRLRFTKSSGFNSNLRPGEPVELIWYDDAGVIVGRTSFKMIFDQEFQSGALVTDENSALIHLPQAARLLSAQFGVHLITNPVRIAE